MARVPLHLLIAAAALCSPSSSFSPFPSHHHPPSRLPALIGGDQLGPQSPPLLESIWDNELPSEHASALNDITKKLRNPFRPAPPSNPKAPKKEQIRLTKEEEGQLSRQVQVLCKLHARRSALESKLSRPPTDEEWASVVGCTTPQLRSHVQASQAAKTRLVAANTGMVYTIARAYRNRGVAMEDLIQEGNFGLLEAVDRFDPGKGFKFSTYGAWWIRQKITRAISNQSRVIRLPVHVHATLRQMSQTARALAAETGRSPTRVEVARRMNVPSEKLERIADAQRAVVSLELPVAGSATDQRRLADRIADKDECPEGHAEVEMLRSDLIAAMADLDARERDVVNFRFGIRDGVPRTHGEIAGTLGLTRERVRLIEARALKKLRHPTRYYHLREYLSGTAPW